MNKAKIFLRTACVLIFVHLTGHFIGHTGWKNPTDPKMQENEKGATTELINLYDIQFKGCTSCFTCKLKGNTVSKCAMKDNLAPVLQKIYECDVLVLGSPVYFSSVTGEMRSFMERLLFPYCSYEGKPFN